MMNRRDALKGLACGTAAWGLGTAARAAEPRIVLGQSAALTGPAGELGRQFKLGAEMVFRQVNAAGGVNGQAIELQSLDDGYEPQACAANTRRLIDSGVFALFGYVGTATSLAALPLAVDAKKPFFAPFTGSEALRIPFNRYAFHLRASYVDETNAIVDHLTTVGIKRIGVFYQNDGDGKAGLLGAARALKRQYQSPTGLGMVERNSTDVGRAVASVLAEKPDAIITISTYQTCAAFVRAARKAGFQGVFYNLSLVGSQALATELGADARGVAVCQVMPFPFSPTTRVTTEYLAQGAKLGEGAFKPNYSSMEGYIAAKVFVEGLRRAQARQLSADALIGGLESIRGLDLGGFQVDFSAEKHTGSNFVDLSILTSYGQTRR